MEENNLNIEEREESPEVAEPTELSAETSQMVEASDIWEVENIRDQMDPSGIDELAANIATHGLMHPLTVRPASGKAKHSRTYELVYGYRRKAACEQLGHSEIPVVVRELSDQELLEEMISENLQREDLSAMAEARAMKRLKDTFGLSNRQVAERLGVHRSQVGKRLALLELPGKVQEKVEQGAITASHAEVIMRLEDPAEQEQVAELAVKSRASVDKLAGYVSGIIAEQDRKHSASEEHDMPAPRVDDPAVQISLPDFRITPMSRLELNGELKKSDRLRAQCYAMMRAGNDIELEEWLAENLGVSREGWWEWLRYMDTPSLEELSWTLTARWMMASHRLSTFPQELIDQLGEVVSEPRAEISGDEIPGEQ